MTALLHAPSHVRRDRKRCETYVNTHRLLKGYVDRFKAVTGEMERELSEILDDEMRREATTQALAREVGREGV